MNIPNDRDSIPNSSPDQTEHSLIGILKEKLTTKQTRQSIENYEEGLGKANVILPDCFYDVTKEMSNNAYETRGIMLAKKDIRDEKEMYLVKYLQTIGR
ncbi:MAG: hypothetical protein LBU27_06725 [Candidatus Peribacteria bacterium]|jgi:hypothetical protein|nr:hypothetical protein [Candidatus Peribacteria bacterium]